MEQVQVLPVLVDDDGPCTPVADDHDAEMFALYEDGALSDLFETRAEAEAAAAELRV